MKVKLILPIETLRGKLRQDGYYFRMYKGVQIVQRCPTKWKDTPARKAAREKFVARYGRRKPAYNAGPTDEEKRNKATNNAALNAAQKKKENTNLIK